MLFRRWWLWCGVVLAGVVALNGVVNGVVDAKAAPARGAVCARGGATATDGVSGRGLVCVQTRDRGLRWRFAPTAVTTTTTTTVPTTVPGVVAPVVVSASADNGVQVTVAEMRPNTGVYSLQWVPYGQTFNTYQMTRATSASMSVPAGWFACNRTYTFRVFVMQADWQLADGHQTQNVTSHSTPFDVVMPACPTPATTTTTTTIAPASCATGGTCAVGNTGPGGGIVFYVASTNFTSTGSDCGTACKYLEAAPTDQSIDIAWCSNTTSALGTTATAIGTGMANTTTADGTCTSGAIQIAADYANNGKIDWHLPSKDELNQMCKWQRGQAWVSDATICDATGILNSGTGASGFAAAIYWSSSEQNTTNAWFQGFGGGGQFEGGKVGTSRVRSVRAF